MRGVAPARMGGKANTGDSTRAYHRSCERSGWLAPIVRPNSRFRPDPCLRLPSVPAHAFRPPRLTLALPPYGTAGPSEYLGLAEGPSEDPGGDGRSQRTLRVAAVGPSEDPGHDGSEWATKTSRSHELHEV